MLVTEYFYYNLIALFVTTAVTLITYYKWSRQYWKRKNLPHLEPKPFFSNFGKGGERQHIGLSMKRVYDTMKQRGWKHGGMYGSFDPIYVVVDLDYLKNILTKDFQNFSDRGTYYNEKGDPLSANLFNLGGVRWRNLRTTLTPTFTSGKLKMMFQTLVDCEESLQERMQKEYEKEEPIDIKEVLRCFTTDIIGSCAFGLNCNTFQEENSPFRVFGKKILERPRLLEIRRSFANTFPNLSRFLNIATHAEELMHFFTNVVRDTIDHREKNNISRKDFMQLLLDLKNNKLAEEKRHTHDGTTLTIEEIVGQCYAFFVGGFETSSSTMAFALYELARHQDFQEKLRNEINSVLAQYDGKITYEAIQKMKYMSQVVDETLRMYPPLAVLQRRCTQDYQIPDSDIVIEKNTMVLIPVFGIHYDQEYYPEPEKFNPERFTEENKQSRHSYSYIPFGEGPKNCIGMRFGLVQTKVGLVSVLRKYRFTVNKKMKEPLKFQPSYPVLAVEGEIWLDAHKL